MIFRVIEATVQSPSSVWYLVEVASGHVTVHVSECLGRIDESRLRKYAVKWPVRQQDKGRELAYRTVYVAAESPEEAMKLVVGEVGEDGFPSMAPQASAVVKGGRLLPNGVQLTLVQPNGKVETRIFPQNADITVDGKPGTWDDVYLGWAWVVDGTWKDGSVVLTVRGMGGKLRKLTFRRDAKITIDGVEASWGQVKGGMMVREGEAEDGRQVLQLHRSHGLQHKEMKLAMTFESGVPRLNFSTTPQSYMNFAQGGDLSALGKYYDNIASRPDKRGGGRMTKGWPREMLRPGVEMVDDADKVMGQLNFRDEHRHKATPSKFGVVYDADDIGILAREYLALSRPVLKAISDLDALLGGRARKDVASRVQAIRAAWAALRNAYQDTKARRDTVFRHLVGGDKHLQVAGVVPDAVEMPPRYDPSNPIWDPASAEDEDEAIRRAKLVSSLAVKTNAYMSNAVRRLEAKVGRRENWASSGTGGKEP